MTSFPRLQLFFQLRSWLFGHSIDNIVSSRSHSTMLRYLGLSFTPRTDLRGALRSFACGDLRVVHGAFSSSPPPGRISLSSRFNSGNLSFKVAASSQVASSTGSQCHFTQGSKNRSSPVRLGRFVTDSGLTVSIPIPDMRLGVYQFETR